MNEKIVAVKHVGEPENFHCSHLHTTKGGYATMTESVYNELAAEYPGLYELVDDEETEATLLEHCEANGCGSVKLEAYVAYKAQAEDIAVEDEDDEEEEEVKAPAKRGRKPAKPAPETEDNEEEEAEEEEAPAPPVRPAPRGRGRGKQ